MTCRDTQRLMDGYLDGALADMERAVLEDHLAACFSCREVLAQLKALLDEAGKMSMTKSPPRDLWPAIRSRIEERMVQTADLKAGMRRFVRPAYSLIAAAAVLLVVFASVVTLRLSRDGLDSLEIFQAEWSRGLITIAAMEKQYAGATEDLVSSMGEYQESLPEPTRKVIEDHLQMIEGAIEDSRAALADNPSDAELQSMLSTTCHQKVALLQWTVQLTTQF